MVNLLQKIYAISPIITFLITVLIVSSCLKIDKNASNSSVVQNPYSDLTPPKKSSNLDRVIVDFNSYVGIKFDPSVKSDSHIIVKTTDGKILFSGAVFSLKAKGKVILPHKQSGLVVSLDNPTKNKLFPIRNGAIQVGRF